MSVLPISFFRICFSAQCSVNGELLETESPTDSGLLDFLLRNPNNGENLDHYLYDNIYHFRGWRHFCVILETPEKYLNSVKDVHRSVLTCPNIINGLRDVNNLIMHAKLFADTHRKENADPNKDQISS
jgi:hypothetical protein